MREAGLFGEEARLLGKSARTRARLMDAAVQLFARDGFEAASVNEIARMADVANGTFYVHFRDKDDISAAVAFGMAQEVVRQLDDAMTHVEGAVERVSMATRRFIDLAVSQPDWGRALFRAVWRFRALKDGVVGYLRADLALGVEQGVFTTAIDEVLIDGFAAMTLGALFGRLEGHLGEEAGARTSELQLLMLGVAPDRAAEVSRRPLAPLVLTMQPLKRQ